ncbi:LacI family DNA-binding transcriptional regulator [Aquipuribacter sp. MA13-6]|uniref:LacI family DNA-binding transcriptional regulator n=1 Tax=unclassified Aquipuribacter TaxID=2635084 RepID=UPI003EEB99DF
MTSDRPRPATLVDVATRAGVGRGTASRALTGSSAVSPAVRAAVLKAADELDYRPNLAARSLRSRRSGSVALVVPETEDVVFTDSFFSGILRGVNAELTDAGLLLVLSLPRTDAQRHQIQRHAVDGHVDGVILISAHDTDPLPAALLAAGVPVVTAGRPSAGTMPSVDVDNRGGARAATEHLIGTGRRVVTTITGPQDMSAGTDRVAGWRDAVTAAGLPTHPRHQADGEFTEEGGYRAMQRLLQEVPDLDGVFVASDLMAAGALTALREAGTAVPGDVGVVGFDDRPLARHLSPPLTTVCQPIEDLGRGATRLLLGLLAGEPPPEAPLVLPTHLVLRAST